MTCGVASLAVGSTRDPKMLSIIFRYFASRENFELSLKLSRCFCEDLDWAENN